MFFSRALSDTRIMEARREHWRTFCFAQEEMFVIPPEALTPRGLDPEFATLLRERAALPSGWIQLFEQAFALYWERAKELHRLAPAEWFPPRSLHCCIAVDRWVRPYFQPLRHVSWRFEARDFDPSVSTVEFAAYLFFHFERMSWTQDVLDAFTRNVGYFLVRRPEELADFARGCRQTLRPDAAAFRALADALPWFMEAFHPELKPRRVWLPVREFPIPGTRVSLPVTRRAEWTHLVDTCRRTAERVVEDNLRHFRAGRKDHGKQLLDWLASHRPQVVLCVERRVVWSPDDPDRTQALRAVLRGIGREVAESLQRDWLVIDAHSRSFLTAVGGVTSLGPAPANIDPGGLCWLHREEKRLAYDLQEPGMLRLQTPAPPYERLMLGARAAHEWGHWFDFAGGVPISPGQHLRYEERCAELVDLCQRIVREAPAPIRQALADELEQLRERHGSEGKGLAAIPLSRLPDYRANLVARRFLSEPELHTYVRSNVTCLRQSMRPRAIFQRLVRYAYEFQYLCLLAGLPDPWTYFDGVAWFEREFHESELVQRATRERLFEIVGEICRLHQLDTSRIRVPHAAR